MNVFPPPSETNIDGRESDTPRVFADSNKRRRIHPKFAARFLEQKAGVFADGELASLAQYTNRDFSGGSRLFHDEVELACVVGIGGVVGYHDFVVAKGLFGCAFQRFFEEMDSIHG